MKNFFAITFLLFQTLLLAQSTEQPPAVTFSGYVEPYYVYGFDKPLNHGLPAFLYSYNRHNEVNLNLGMLKAAYAQDRVRANMALMAGTYTNANLSAEPGVLRNVLEANAGVKISKSKNLWIDAGIFGSHIGFESAIGKDCWNLTRGMGAENSPYFESGVKLGYTSDDGKWFLSGLLLNGWQRIQRVEGNNTPAFGHQLTYKPNDRVTLNSSSFLGNDKPDSLRQMRYFHDFYGIFQLNKSVALTVGFDYGVEQTAKDSRAYNSWLTPVCIVRFALNDQMNLAVRGEYYQDKNGVIISTGTPNGFQTLGFSANLDYTLNEHAMWRIEARGFNSKDDIFTLDGAPSQNYFMVASSLAISF